MYIYIIYIYIYIYISINGRRINYKCIIATNSFSVLSQSSGYTIWKKTVL